MTILTMLDYASVLVFAASGWPQWQCVWIHEGCMDS